MYRMADNVFFSRFLNLRFFMVLCVATALASCGGDDNDSDPTPAPTATPTITPTPTPTAEPDREPDAITFAPVTDATRNTEQTSAVVNITGIDPGTSLSIAGGEYQLGGSGGFVNTETTIDSGTSVQLRTNASANFSETVTVTLTVGTSNFDFVVTTEDQDITPADFSFTEQTNLPRNAAVAAAETITITEVNDTVSVSVQNGMYRINGGDFTADPGTAELSDEVEVAIMTSADFNTPITATLTIGTLSADFTGSTELDNEPDAFALVDQTDADRGEEFTQGPFTLTGIETDIEVTISEGATFSLDGINFSNTPTTLSDGQELWIRGIASSEYGGIEEITVVAGITTSRFTITTFVDEQQPEVTIQFPPPSTMTEGENVLIRGIASDRSAITRLQINGLDAEDTSGDDEPAFSTWQLRVDLTLDQTNTLTVTAEDEAENINNVNSVNLLRVADIGTESFPDNNVVLGGVSQAVIDRTRNRLIVAGDFSSNNIIAVNLSTGERSLIYDGTGVDQRIFGLTIDSNNEFLYISENEENVIIRLNLNVENITPLSDAYEVLVDLDDSARDPIIPFLYDLIVNPLNDRELIVGFPSGLFAYSLDTDDVRIISSASTAIEARPNEELPFQGLNFVWDEENQKLLVSTDFPEILEIDPTDGSRRVLSTNSNPGGTNRENQLPIPNDNLPRIIQGLFITFGAANVGDTPSKLAIDSQSRILYVDRGTVNDLSDTVPMYVNIDTGERFVLSENTAPNVNTRITEVVFDERTRTLYWFDESRNNVMVLDPLTGERVVLSKFLRD